MENSEIRKILAKHIEANSILMWCGRLPTPFVINIAHVKWRKCSPLELVGH